jgi:YnbE-like lipoprotein
MTPRTTLMAGAGFAILAACTHTIRIEPSDKPIKIDLNITQEVRIILDKQVEDLIADNPDLF